MLSLDNTNKIEPLDLATIVYPKLVNLIIVYREHLIKVVNNPTKNLNNKVPKH